MIWLSLIKSSKGKDKIGISTIGIKSDRIEF